MITLEVTKNQFFTLYLEETFLEKPQGLEMGGGQINPHSFLGLKVTLLQQQSKEQNKALDQFLHCFGFMSHFRAHNHNFYSLFLNCLIFLYHIGFEITH